MNPDPSQLSIVVRALDGAWETLGTEGARYRGVVPENVQFSADQWGSSTCSFELRRFPTALYPDLAAFTECEIWVAGMLCWSGRVRETPTREGADPVISVQGQGWQYHLDDDLYQRTYVRTRLDGWTDMRSTPNAVLAETSLAAAGQVSVDGEALTLTFPVGGAFWAGTMVGCYLDLGPEPASWAKRIYSTYTSSNNTAGVTVYGRCSSSGPDNSASGWAFFEDLAGSGGALTSFGASGVWSGTLAEPRRWIQIFIYFPAGGGGATGADHWFRLSSIRIFSDATYESGGVSSLKADTIVKDALTRATFKLHSDRSEVSAATFAIPEFEMSGYQTPREVISAANAFENYETKIDVDRRPLYRPRAVAPLYEIGEWSGAEFEDASANSGEDVINRVIVQGTGAGGVPISVTRWTPGGESSIGVAQVSNQSADVNVTGWTLYQGSGTLSRNTTTFRSAPGSFQVSGAVGPRYESNTVTMSMRAGERYVASVWRLNSVAPIANSFVEVVTGSTRLAFVQALGSTATWTEYRAEWVQPFDAASYKIRVQFDDAGFFDDVWVYRFRASTVVDRQGFVRARVMPVQNRVTEASAARLGDLYLDQHKTTPFTGGFKATGVGGVRRTVGGTSVHPAWLARETGQLVRIGHVTDPDTGAVGRDERIASVNYDHNTLTSTVSLSEDRGGFDALLGRLAAVVK